MGSRTGKHESPGPPTGNFAIDALRASEERYRRLAEDTPVLICTFLPDSTLTYVNAAYAEYFEREPAELLGRRFVEFLPDDGTRERTIEQYLSLTPRRPLITYEHSVMAANGSERWQRWTDRAFFDECGNHAYFQSVGDDITERKRYEERVGLMSAAIEAAADATAITDERGGIEWVNPAFTALTGYTFDEAVGRDHGQLLKSGVHDETFYRKLWQTVLAGHTWRGELINRKKDGSRYTEEQTITPVRDANGRIRHFIAIKHDVTARKEAETEVKELRERLYESRRMEAVGQLAGRMAHDMNNLLVPIRGYADLILTKCSPTGKEKGYLEEIAGAADRAAELIGKILAFGRGQVLRPEPLSLNTVIGEFENVLRPMLGEGIEFDRHLDPDARVLQGDRAKLEQVILNLALNARDAMPGGGKVTLSTANAVVDEGYAFKLGREIVLPGRYVVMTVADTGQGMTPEVRQRAFEPFFTTRDTGEGRGLGLATIYGIVKQHDGYVGVRSEPGRGSVFEVYLRAVEEVPKGDSREDDARLGLRGSETVLVIEQDPNMRGLVTHALESHGYVTLGGRDPAKARELAASYQGRIDLLVTEFFLADRTAPEFFKHLTVQQPDVKVLYLSGYPGEFLDAAALDPPAGGILQKPFAVHEFLRKVRDVLGN